MTEHRIRAAHLKMCERLPTIPRHAPEWNVLATAIQASDPLCRQLRDGDIRAALGTLERLVWCQRVAIDATERTLPEVAAILAWGHQYLHEAGS